MDPLNRLITQFKSEGMSEENAKSRAWKVLKKWYKKAPESAWSAYSVERQHSKRKRGEI